MKSVPHFTLHLLFEKYFPAINIQTSYTQDTHVCLRIVCPILLLHFNQS
jgi:hypothetical protein